MRKLLSLFLILAAALGGYMLRAKSGGKGFDFDLFGSGGQTTEIQSAGHHEDLAAPKTADTIRIASFNIQAFGTSKSGKSDVMGILTQIVRQFDIVAIQEVRSKDETLIPTFVSMINSMGAQYEYVLGPRLGRTVSKEQYVFIFDSATIEIDRNATYTVADPHDRMHREPLVAFFRARTASPQDAFTFKLINIHTDPDDVPEEMNALDDVYRGVLNDGDREDDVIVLGDFNTSEQKLYEFGHLSSITSALSDVMTNTRRTKSYDNLYFHGQQTREFNGKAGVVDLVRVFNITTEQSLEVSDHLPVWAEFSIFEGGGPNRLATRPEGGAATPQ